MCGLLIGSHTYCTACSDVLEEVYNYHTCDRSVALLLTSSLHSRPHAYQVSILVALVDEVDRE